MSRTTRSTYFDRSPGLRERVALNWDEHYRGKRIERDAMFNGRDNHRGEICGASNRSPKGKDAWGEYWGYDKRGVKRATAKIIRRRGSAGIREEVIDFHRDNHNNREND